MTAPRNAFIVGLCAVFLIRSSTALQSLKNSFRVISHSRGVVGVHRHSQMPSYSMDIHGTSLVNMQLSMAKGDSNSLTADSSSIKNRQGWLKRAIESESIRMMFKFVRNVWDFSRPHTIIGSALSITCLYMFAIPQSLWLTKDFFGSLMTSAIPSLLMNLYVTGLNQLTDVEIDKINKPYLPLASGALAYSQGLLIVLSSLCGSLYLSRAAALPLRATLAGSALLGTIYSMPPFRLKRFPLLAAICILSVRGSLVNMGFFLQAKSDILGIDVGNTISSLIQNTVVQFPEILLVTSFFALFGLIIAVMKDIPDVPGDRLFSIKSFSVQLGQRKMFNFSSKLLMGLLSASSAACLLASAIPLLACWSSGVSNIFQHSLPKFTLNTSISRFLIGFGLYFMGDDVKKKAKLVIAENSSNVFEYYMYLWNVFYLCYVILPFLK